MENINKTYGWKIMILSRMSLKVSEIYSFHHDLDKKYYNNAQNW